MRNILVVLTAIVVCACAANTIHFPPYGEFVSLNVREGRSAVQLEGGNVQRPDYLSLLICRTSIDAANLDQFTVGIRLDGKIVQKRYGDPDVPELPGCASCQWCNYMTIIPEVSPPYEVVVVDKFNNRKFVFSVSGEGIVSTLEE
jgi:hypothetical protein